MSNLTTEDPRKFNPMTMPPNDGTRHYKTAKALIACAAFKKGEYVSVQYEGTRGGVNWFNIVATESGPLAEPIPYPHHHLSEFCL